MADKVDQKVIDEFRRSSVILDALTFDDSVAPGTGGSTMTYGYVQLQTPATAARRELNAEYVAQEATRIKKTADLDIFGGAFNIDRVIQNTSGAVDETAFQIAEKVKAASNLFNYVAINGEVKPAEGTTTPGFVEAKFDGLRKLVAGTSTDVTPGTAIDISTAAKAKTNADAVLVEIYDWLGLFGEKPDMLLMNSKMLSKLAYIARLAGYYERSEDAFGRKVDRFDGIPMIDAGKYWNGSQEIDIVGTDSTGASSILGVKYGLNAFHGIAPMEKSAFIHTYLPDFNAPGAVKKGEAELVAGVVLKNSKMAGALNNIKC